MTRYSHQESCTGSFVYLSVRCPSSTLKLFSCCCCFYGLYVEDTNGAFSVFSMLPLIALSRKQIHRLLIGN
ncbi:hypothetical protein V6N13_033364 [Hibiscus sabdariffa]